MHASYGSGFFIPSGQQIARTNQAITVSREDVNRFLTFAAYLNRVQHVLGTPNDEGDVKLQPMIASPPPPAPAPRPEIVTYRGDLVVQTGTMTSGFSTRCRRGISSTRRARCRRGRPPARSPCRSTRASKISRCDKKGERHDW